MTARTRRFAFRLGAILVRAGVAVNRWATR
jgi:hypothetical protein